MQNLNPHKVGLVSGMGLAAWHLVWLVLVFFGVAQSILDFILRLHSLAPSFVVMPFDLMNSALLLVVTFVIGYIVGYVGTLIWNRVHGM